MISQQLSGCHQYYPAEHSGRIRDLAGLLNCPVWGGDLVSSEDESGQLVCRSARWREKLLPIDCGEEPSETRQHWTQKNHTKKMGFRVWQFSKIVQIVRSYSRDILKYPSVLASLGSIRPTRISAIASASIRFTSPADSGAATLPTSPTYALRLQHRLCERVRLLGLGPSGERRTRCLESLKRHMSGPLSSSLDPCRLPLFAA
jgi:hypothetical protein